MPLTEPSGGLREKLGLIGAGGAGKTSCWASIAWWAKQSNDTRTFWVLDTDDEAVRHVLLDPKYDGMIHSVNEELVNEDGNIRLYSAYTWSEYQQFSDKAVANAVKGDFIVVDFYSHAWSAAQDGFLQDSISRSREDVLYEAGVKGLAGWDMYKTEFNWQAINSSFFAFCKPIFLSSRAHVFVTAGEEKIVEGGRMTDDAKEHLAQFGQWKAAGAQKALPYQVRTFLRIQRLARGRVLYTLKDRARKELNGDTCNDFFTGYMRGVASWGVSD